MASVAESMINVLIGEKWAESVKYLQLLCFVGIFYPLHALNLNILQVFGKSDLFLRLELIKKAISIPLILSGMYYGIFGMLVALIINSFLSLFVNGYWSKLLIGYSIGNQLKELAPAFLVTLCVCVPVYLMNFIVGWSDLTLLLCQIIAGSMLWVFLCELLNFGDYKYLKSIVMGSEQWSIVKNKLGF